MRFLSHVDICDDHRMKEKNHKLTYIWSSNEKKKRKFVVAEIINSLKWKSMVKYRDCFQLFESCAKRTLKEDFKKTNVCWFLFRVNNFSSSCFSHSRYSFSIFFSSFHKFFLSNKSWVLNNVIKKNRQKYIRMNIWNLSLI